MFYSVALYLNFCGRVSHVSQELTDLTQLASQVPLVSSSSAFYVRDCRQSLQQAFTGILGRRACSQMF